MKKYLYITRALDPTYLVIVLHHQLDGSIWNLNLKQASKVVSDGGSDDTVPLQRMKVLVWFVLKGFIYWVTGWPGGFWTCVCVERETEGVSLFLWTNTQLGPKGDLLYEEPSSTNMSTAICHLQTVSKKSFKCSRLWELTITCNKFTNRSSSYIPVSVVLYWIFAGRETTQS